MAAYTITPTAAARGKFADQYVTCRACRQPLLDVDDRGLHPLCDTSPEWWWTPAQQAAWLADRQQRQETTA